MLRRKPQLELMTQRLVMRPPVLDDHAAWCRLRRQNEAYLRPWEPRWGYDHFDRNAFRARVRWAKRSIDAGTAISLFIFAKGTGDLIGAITLDAIRRGPSERGQLGYWISEHWAGRGLMTEAVTRLTEHAFAHVGISRLEAACLPDNQASRKVLERSGFKYEGVAQSYLQINGHWRTHVLYACLRPDRRGRVA